MNSKENNKGILLVTFTIILVILLIIAIGVIIYLLNNPVKENTVISKLEQIENTNSLSETKENIVVQNLVQEEKPNSSKNTVKEKYTNNLTDAQNGKTAFLELVSKNILQTEKHTGYYTYVDSFENKYNIKEIKKVVSEKGIMGTDNWAALFKVTVTYIDNNNKINTMELAIVLLPNHEIQNQGKYEDYTGTTSFARAFSDL